MFSRSVVPGPRGPAGPTSVGTAAAMALAFATAYQANDPTKPAFVTVHITSTAQLTLSGGQTHTAELVIGPTNQVASGVGTVVGRYTNANTGTLTIGLGINNTATNPLCAVLPAGWFFAIRSIAGAPAIVSSFCQSIG